MEVLVEDKAEIQAPQVQAYLHHNKVMVEVLDHREKTLEAVEVHRP
jgi:hypothetical protein